MPGDRPETAAEALELARDWAEGRRSWINLRGPEGVHNDSYSHEAIAVMDAQEVVKWSALAQALHALGDPHRSPPGTPPAPGRKRRKAVVTHGGHGGPGLCTVQLEDGTVYPDLTIGQTFHLAATEYLDLVEPDGNTIRPR